MKTEIENRIEKALFDLIENAGKLLSVEFVPANRYEDPFAGKRNEELKTKVWKMDMSVRLILVEPTNQKDLEDWADAIVDAEELLGKIEDEIVHAANNPNFFKAIKTKFEYSKIRSAL